MGRAHSNAYCQAPHFFDLSFELRRKVICGRNRDALDKIAATWGWDETATDWRAVVDRKDIDVVDVATPNLLHAEIAIAAARAGKMIFCEKPLAVSVDEGARMVEAARGVPNMVWYNYRRVPGIAFSSQSHFRRAAGADLPLSRRLSAGVGQRSHAPAGMENPEGDRRIGRAGRPDVPRDRYSALSKRADPRGFGHHAHVRSRPRRRRRYAAAGPISRTARSAHSRPRAMPWVAAIRIVSRSTDRRACCGSIWKT